MEWAIVILSLATIVSVATAFYLYRWRKIMFQKGDGSEEVKFIMPEEPLRKHCKPTEMAIN